ncbi:MAG: VOC family protein [Cyclobacteriaceae bacterium]
MSTIIGYDNFILPAKDLVEAKEFYQNKLSLEIKFEFYEKEMIALKAGDNEPAFILRKAENLRPTIMLKVDSVKKSLKELQEKGIQFIAEPIEINTGLYAELQDPTGNKFAITDYSKTQ